MGSILNDFEILDLLNMDELIWLEEAPPVPVHYTLDLADSVTLSEVVGSNFQIGLGDSVGLEDSISLVVRPIVSPIVAIRVSPSDADMYQGGSIDYSLIATHEDGSESEIADQASWSVIGSAAIFDTTIPWRLKSVSTGSGTVVANYGGLSPSATATFTVHSPLIVAQSADVVGAYSPDPDYYLKFITSQYQNSPNFLAWTRGFLEIIQSIMKLAVNLPYYFSFSRIVDKASGAYIPGALTVESGDYVFEEMDAAIGNQLDVLGEILGVGRVIDFKPTDGSSSTLDDETYRILLKNKVLRNHWDGKAASIQEAWSNLFPGGKIIVQDNQNMTVDVTITGGFSQLIIDLIEHDYIVPRPQGVLMNYYVGTVSPSNLPFFGFDRDDTYVSGFDKGHWV